MIRCRWCEEEIKAGKYCDELCEKLDLGREAAKGPSARFGNQERTKRQLSRKRNKEGDEL